MKTAPEDTTDPGDQGSSARQAHSARQAGLARFRHGGYAALITMLVLAALVFANLVVGQLPLKLDLSAMQLYSLSPQTLDFLKGLKEDLTIYGLFKPGREPSDIVEILRRYRDASPKIRLEFFDIDKSPSFSKKYDTSGQGLGQGSLVVAAAGSGRFKVIPYSELYRLSANQRTGQEEVQAIATEQRVTSAIIYATGGKTSIVYELGGHSEFTVEQLGLASDLAAGNIELRPLSLLSVTSIPSDADLVVELSPKSDLLPGEVESLKRFLEAGGNALFLIDRMKSPLGNLEGLINLYGVATTQGFVLEGGQSNTVAGRPNLLIPDLGKHSILDSIRAKNYLVTMLNAQGLDLSSLKKRNLKIDALVLSSPESWLRTDLGSDSMTRIASDRDGPFALAFAVEDRKDDPAARSSRLVVVGSSLFVLPEAMSQYMGPGNKELFLNMVAWSAKGSEGLGIRPKSTLLMPVQLNAHQAVLWILIIVVLLPGLVMAMGLVMWSRRRHR